MMVLNMLLLTSQKTLTLACNMTSMEVLSGPFKNELYTITYLRTFYNKFRNFCVSISWLHTVRMLTNHLRMLVNNFLCCLPVEVSR